MNKDDIIVLSLIFVFAISMVSSSQKNHSDEQSMIALTMQHTGNERRNERRHVNRNDRSHKSIKNGRIKKFSEKSNNQEGNYLMRQDLNYVSEQ